MGKRRKVEQLTRRRQKLRLSPSCSDAEEEISDTEVHKTAVAPAPVKDKQGTLAAKDSGAVCESNADNVNDTDATLQQFLNEIDNLEKKSQESASIAPNFPEKCVWLEVWDDFYGRNYFYNSETKESTWIRPENVKIKTHERSFEKKEKVEIVTDEETNGDRNDLTEVDTEPIKETSEANKETETEDVASPCPSDEDVNIIINNPEPSKMGAIFSLTSYGDISDSNESDNGDRNEKEIVSQMDVETNPDLSSIDIDEALESAVDLEVKMVKTDTKPEPYDPSYCTNLETKISSFGISMEEINPFIKLFVEFELHRKNFNSNIISQFSYMEALKSIKNQLESVEKSIEENGLELKWDDNRNCYMYFDKNLNSISDINTPLRSLLTGLGVEQKAIKTDMKHLGTSDSIENHENEPQIQVESIPQPLSKQVETDVMNDYMPPPLPKESHPSASSPPPPPPLPEHSFVPESYSEHAKHVTLPSNDEVTIESEDPVILNPQVCDNDSNHSLPNNYPDLPPEFESFHEDINDPEKQYKAYKKLKKYAKQLSKQGYGNKHDLVSHFVKKLNERHVSESPRSSMYTDETRSVSDEAVESREFVDTPPPVQNVSTESSNHEMSPYSSVHSDYSSKDKVASQAEIEINETPVEKLPGVGEVVYCLPPQMPLLAVEEQRQPEELIPPVSESKSIGIKKKESDPRSTNTEKEKRKAKVKTSSAPGSGFTGAKFKSKSMGKLVDKWTKVKKEISEDPDRIEGEYHFEPRSIDKLRQEQRRFDHANPNLIEIDEHRNKLK